MVVVDALVLAIPPLVGVVVGAAVSAYLQRWSARQRVLGEQFTKRRMELAEELAALIPEVGGFLDSVEHGVGPAPTRSAEELLMEWEQRAVLLRLYVDEELSEEIGRITQALFDEVEPSGKPGSGLTFRDFDRVKGMLAEVVAGGRLRVSS